MTVVMTDDGCAEPGCILEATMWWDGATVCRTHYDARSERMDRWNADRRTRFEMVAAAIADVEGAG